MEGSHCKLCTRLTDRLSSYNTYRLTYLDRLTCCHVRTIALRADTNMTAAGKYCTNLNLSCNSCFHYSLGLHYPCCTLRGNDMICLNYNFAIVIIYSLAGISSFDPLFKALYLFLAIHKSRNPHTRNFFLSCLTIIFSYNKILRYIYKPSGKISRIGCTKSCIGKTFSCSMCGNEILQNVKSLTEV